MDSLVLILGASVVLIISFFSNILAKRTNIPAVLMLMVLGYVLQQFAGFSQESIRPYLEILGTVGVILIVLEASLDLKLEKDKTSLIVTSGVLALVLLLLTTAIIAVGIYLIYGSSFMEYFANAAQHLADHAADHGAEHGADHGAAHGHEGAHAPSEVNVNSSAWYVSFLYAIPLAVMSSAIIIPSVGGLIDVKKELLIFESAFSDILGIIFFYAMLSADHAEEGSNLMVNTFGGIILTLVLSVVVSYALIILFQYISGGAKMALLIAILMGFYAVGKLYHLSPLILILVFGLFLNNRKLFFQGRLAEFVKEHEFEEILEKLHLITLETAFVVRTFFFVIFGMSIVLSQILHWTVPIITLIVMLAIYGTRYGGLRVALGKDIYPEIFVAPRGLITVLLFYAIPTHLAPVKDMGIAEDGVTHLTQPIFEPGILLLTILLSSLIMTYGLIRDARENEGKPQVIPPDGGGGSEGSTDGPASNQADGGDSPQPPAVPPVTSFPPPGQEID